MGILFAFLPLFINNSSFTARNREITLNYDDKFYRDNLKISALSGKIHIDDTNPSMNWSVAKKDGICTGNGTYSEPYVIEDLVIDGGGSGSCILIENSDVYFRIENCTVFNSEIDPTGEFWFVQYAGILLKSVINAQLLGNNCSFNNFGIFLDGGNNTIAGNIVNNNKYSGIIAFWDNNSTISGNTANKNITPGIYLYGGNYTKVSGNIAKYNTHFGILVQGSDYNNVSGNTVSSIYLYDSDYNIVSGNTATRIALEASDYNIVTGNDACCGEVGEVCQGNIFSDNGPCPKEDNFTIELIILISIISGGALIGVTTILLIRHKRKIIE